MYIIYINVITSHAFIWLHHWITGHIRLDVVMYFSILVNALHIRLALPKGRHCFCFTPCYLIQDLKLRWVRWVQWKPRIWHRQGIAAHRRCGECQWDCPFCPPLFEPHYGIAPAVHSSFCFNQSFGTHETSSLYISDFGTVFLSSCSKQNMKCHVLYKMLHWALESYIKKWSKIVGECSWKTLLSQSARCTKAFAAPAAWHEAANHMKQHSCRP